MQSTPSEVTPDEPDDYKGEGQVSKKKWSPPLLVVHDGVLSVNNGAIVNATFHDGGVHMDGVDYRPAS